MRQRSLVRNAVSVSLATTMLVALAAAQSVESASATLKVLFSFDGVNGAFPFAGLIRDSAGNLYGTTVFANPATAMGNVFRLDPTGKLTVLFSFTGGADGGHPEGGLVRDSAGILYGTTQDGGDLSCFLSRGSGGCGVVFKLDPSGKETILHSFAGETDGARPDAGLLRDGAGNLYGTTELGGDLSACNGTGCGVVFKLDPNGNETVLHTFIGSDGANPTAVLVRDLAGNLYSTTGGGGAFSGGTVFKLDKTGKETVLHSFGHGSDGLFPFAGLIRDAAGNLYGTTNYGGSADLGTVFKLDSTGKETLLHSFTNRNGEGQTPFGGLVRDSNGNLFGTTVSGGDLSACPDGIVPGCGMVFKLDAAGRETVLHTFGGADGASPTAALIRDSAGNLYGTGTNAGPAGFGVVFRLRP